MKTPMKRLLGRIACYLRQDHKLGLVRSGSDSSSDLQHCQLVCITCGNLFGPDRELPSKSKVKVLRRSDKSAIRVDQDDLVDRAIEDYGDLTERILKWPDGGVDVHLVGGTYIQYLSNGSVISIE